MKPAGLLPNSNLRCDISDGAMPISVSFKVSGSGGSTFSLDVEPSMTIEDVKKLAKDWGVVPQGGRGNKG